MAGWPAARAAVRATAVPAEVSRTARASPVLPAAQQTLEADQAHRPTAYIGGMPFRVGLDGFGGRQS